ncbi:MAG: hypothetical protein ABIJ15_05465 [bacterium]
MREFKKYYLEQLLEFLWKQWSLLGVAGYSRSENSNFIDPEALLIFSCTFARYDPRLFDEIVCWLDINGNLINVQRLKKIISGENFGGKNVLSAVADFMSRRHKFLKWQGLIQKEKTEVKESLFFLKDGTFMKQFGEINPIFAEHGFLRGKFEPGEHPEPARLERTACLLLRLRALFGINARSEIISYLLTKKNAHPSRIARETYYSQKTAQDTLVEMARSGLVRITSTGREKHYRLDKEKWTGFLSLRDKIPAWIIWPLLLKALEQLWQKLSDPNFLKLEPELQTSEFRSLIREIGPGIEKAGFPEVLTDERSHPGGQYLSIFQADIRKLLSYLVHPANPQD